ncbi:hypothetical protein J4Q44_G00020910 [Coregonus suidteri]|uniref:RIIa domain-containing protein 1 n=1 Tax=Coregonus suidteri TaxID=861788 RepID=A0AAN8NFL2_9TELE
MHFLAPLPQQRVILPALEGDGRSLFRGQSDPSIPNIAMVPPRTGPQGPNGLGVVIALTAETKSWMVDYGLHCNRKYRLTDMAEHLHISGRSGKETETDQSKTWIEKSHRHGNRLKEIREHTDLHGIDFQDGTHRGVLFMLHKYGLVVAKEGGREGGHACAIPGRKLLALSTEGSRMIGSPAKPPHFREELIDKIETRINNEKYLREHPEVEALISDFLRDVFLKRPTDIREFAADYFTDPNLCMIIGSKLQGDPADTGTD